jgi:hypothetical protein
MDSRRQKARELADRAQIYFKDEFWHVPSQSGAGWYKVLIDENDAVCNCPDFELRDKPCKHILAVKLLMSRLVRGVEQDTKNVEAAPKVKRLTYAQPN